MNLIHPHTRTLAVASSLLAVAAALVLPAAKAQAQQAPSAAQNASGPQEPSAQRCCGALQVPGQLAPAKSHVRPGAQSEIVPPRQLSPSPRVPAM